MTEAFKFLDKAHAGLVASGHLRFGDLRRYRLMEVVFADQWIGDREDGVAISDLGPMRISDDVSDQEDREKAARLGIIGNMGKGSAIEIGRTVFRHSIDGFAFSCAIGDLDTLAETMCRSEGRPNYDACVRIKNVEELARRVTEQVEALHPGTFKVKYGPIDYLRGHAGQVAEPAPADPFKKRAFYAEQAEYRIFLEGRPANTDFIVITVGDDIFEEVVVDDPKGKPNSKMSSEEAIAVLEATMAPIGAVLDKSSFCLAYWTLRPPGGVARLDEILANDCFSPQVTPHVMINRAALGLPEQKRPFE